MWMIDFCSWIAVLLILTVYLKGTPKEYNYANMLLFVFVALPALIRGAYPSAAISILFGIIAAWKVGHDE